MQLEQRPTAEQISYDDLYARWERANWSATAIDFSVDAEQWRSEFSDFQRKAAVWNYALFLAGENYVTDALSAYIEAVPGEEQKFFLTTQQVDEARHSVFFTRFMREVAGIDGDDIRSTLEAVEPQLTWGFKQVFGRLERMVDELHRDRSLPTIAAAITLYHIVIEASMAQPAQVCINRFLETSGLFPGFRAGMENVQRDEHRHIAFGVKMLADLMKEDPECKVTIADMLRETQPAAVATLRPPGWDLRYVEAFGYTLHDLYAEGARSLDTKMRAAGLPFDQMPGVPALPPDMTPEERAQRGIDLLRAGAIGPLEEAPPTDAHHVAVVLDTMRRSVRPDHPLKRPTTLQWEFTDVGPWHIRIDGTTASAHEGSSPAADLRLKVSYTDWLGVIAGRHEPGKLLATRRLQPRGKLWLLPKLDRVFA